MNFKKIFLSSLFIAAFLLRIYHARQLFFWQIDEDIIGLTVKRIIIDHHLQLIGFPIPGGIYLGPAFYYLISIPYLLGMMNPLMFPYLAALLSVFTIWLVYFVGKTIFQNEKIGLLAAFFYGSSGLVNVYNHLLTGLSLTPILSLLTYYLLYRYKLTGNFRTFLTLVIILGVAMQNEGSSLSLLILTTAVFIYYKIPFGKKQLISALLAFFLIHIPLVVFDLRHNFYITSALLNFFNRGGGFDPVSLVSTFSQSLQILPTTLSRILLINGPSSITGQILPCRDLLNLRTVSPSSINFVISVFALLFFAINAIKAKRLNFGLKIILWHLFVILGGIIVYNLFLKGYFYEWILLVFFPGYSYIMAFGIYKLFSKHLLTKLILALLLCLFFIFNILFVLQLNDGFGLEAKSKAVKFAITKVGKENFYLDSIGSCYAQGYIYLFWFYGARIHSTYADDMFTPTFYQRLHTPKPKLGVVIVNASENETFDFITRYNAYKSRAKFSEKFGGIEVLIVED